MAWYNNVNFTVSNRKTEPLFISALPKPAPTPNPTQLASGLAHNESRGVPGNRYAFSQPSGDPALGDALGKYQITEEKLKRKSRELLGREVGKQEFLASPSLQDALIIKILDADVKRFGDHKKAILNHRYENPKAWNRPSAKKYLEDALKAIK